MGFVKRGIDSIDLAGFWNRAVGSVLVGKLLKFVPNDKDPKHVRPFYIVVAGPSPGAFINVEGDDSNVPVTEGAFVGIAANWSITSQLDKVKDIGKLCRFTVDGVKSNPNGGKDMVMVTVEVDE